MENMGFKAFLKQNAKKREYAEYVASDRFVDENGEPVPFKLRVLTNEELDTIRDKHTTFKIDKSTRKSTRVTDDLAMNDEMVIQSIVYPDLKDEELQLSYEVVGESDLLKAMLEPGEYTDLIMACSEVQGFKVGMEDKIKYAKNS